MDENRVGIREGRIVISEAIPLDRAMPWQVPRPEQAKTATETRPTERMNARTAKAWPTNEPHPETAEAPKHDKRAQN